MSIRKEQFTRLRQAVEESIIEAPKADADFEHVRLGYVRCLRVVWWKADSGDRGYTVEIGEAGEDVVEFERWLEEQIREKTGMCVDVTTKW